MRKEYNRKLIFEDGSEYYGYGFGADSECVCEIVFNTSMVGYQEILSDPSYTDQAVVMTYPLIGNYGMADDDYETERPTIGALIISEINHAPSNFRSTQTLDEVMKTYGIPGIWGIDTRKLTRSIRDIGSRKVLLCGIQITPEEGVQILKCRDIPTDAVSRVSCKTIRTEKTDHTDTAPYHVVAVDCGMKKNIIRSLLRKGCDVTVVPYNISAEEILSLHPDGLFLSNGPGDPTDIPELIETIRTLHGAFPTFGICLGHQILCLSYGAHCYKMKFGHRGGNHPVQNLETGKIEITSQNHSYSVDADSLDHTPLQVTHINLLDYTIEGVRYDADHMFSVQYHPESAPGPEDSTYLFDQFIALMSDFRRNHDKHPNMGGTNHAKEN